MRSLLLLNCYLLLIGYSSALNGGNCQISGIQDTHYLIAYPVTTDDTQINTNIVENAYQGNLVVQSCTPTSINFDVLTNASHLIIRTTQAFADFDLRTDKQPESFSLETLNCVFLCEGLSSLIIQIAVNDINTHPPQFSQNKYEFNVATPIMPLTDFSIYGSSPILATDIDFSNQNIVYTIEPNDFNIATTSNSTSKTYGAIFAATRVLQITGDRSYTITATDSGTNPGPLSTLTTITLTVDLTTSIDTPIFESGSYSFNYTIEGNIPKLIQLDGPITIQTNKPDSLSDLTLTGDYRDYFAVNLDKTTGTIDLSPNGILPPETSASYFILTLSVLTDNRASTPVIVYQTQAAIDETPRFNSHVYTGIYNDVTDSVDLNGDIIITSTITPDVTISGAYSEHFTIVYDESSRSYKISIKTNLSGSEIKSLSYINIIITATVGENYDTAALVLSLPNPELQFTNALYNAFYNNDGTITIDSSNPISFTTHVIDVPITIEGTYADNFIILSNPGSNQYIVLVKTPLSNAILRTEKEIVIILRASDTYGDETRSVLKIQLPDVKTDAPTFSEEVYLIEYTDDNNPVIIPDHEIIINNRDNQDNIIISLDSYNDNFNIIYDKELNKWVLRLGKPLSEELLRSRSDIIIIMTAEEQDNPNKGHAVLDISWTTKEAPIFTEVYYRGEYPITGEGIIELDKAINFTNVGDPTSVVIDLDSFADNFDIRYDANKWSLTIKRNLEPVASKNSELTIVLTATENGNKNVGKSVLILELPSTIAPVFSEAYYVADYPESGEGYIEFEYPIKFLNIDDPTTVQISLDNYENNFDIIYDGVNGWYINIKSSLGLDILQKNAEIVATLTAKIKGRDDEGQSALIIKLPTSIDTAPKFSKTYYITDYPKSGSGVLDFKYPIVFSNVQNQLDLSISLDSYNNNFEMIYELSRWRLNIKQSLNESVLNGNVEIVMTLTATETGNINKGQSALVLNLPISTNKIAPEFEDAYYVIEYPETATNIIEFDVPIKFTNVDDPQNVKISLDDFIDNFEIVYNSNRWYINIKNGLRDNILNGNAELVLTMTATEDGNINKGYSALVVKLPSTTTDETSPRFSKTYYIADYPKSGSGIIDFKNPIEVVNVDNPLDVTISLDNYNENFEIIYDSERWRLNIKQRLDDSVLNGNVEIVMTLIATATAIVNEGQSALVLNLPITTNYIAPEFEDAYYVVNYPKITTNLIEFEIPIKFINVNDPQTVKISLDDYVDNFEIVYNSNRWYINVKKGLDESILNKNAELVLTMTATEDGNINKGYSALVVKLPSTTDETGPKFSKIYYIADYPKSGSGIIDFKNPIELSNVANPLDVAISLDSYNDNFEVIYELNRWRLNIKQGLNESVLNENVEIVMTLTATETANLNRGQSVLVLNLPTSTNKIAPKFGSAYYVVQYSASTNIMEFGVPIWFLNVADPQTVKITLDNYADNFEIVYDSNRWYIIVTKGLRESILNSNAELVLTLIATEDGNSNDGYSALVVQLLSPVTDALAPKFYKPYYIADYPKSGSGVIDFKNPIELLNVDNLIDVTISLDNYNDNFEIIYDSDRWRLNIKQGLNETVLNGNVDLVIALTATEFGNIYEGESALVLNLPISANKIAPEFGNTYYVVEYPETTTNLIEFEIPIKFINVNDPQTVKISLDDYVDNFEIVYNSNRWYINVKKGLDKSILNRNAELVLTMIATEDGNINKGYSTLVIKLPSANSALAPKFSGAYYLADYSLNINGYIDFESPITFSNVDDPRTLTISLESFSNNFKIVYDRNTDRWYISIVNNLDDTILNKNAELAITMIATETGNPNQGYSALVLKLPVSSNEAPEFSQAYYLADYPGDSTDVISFESPISLKNVNDPSQITITLDNYLNNFEIIYNTNTNEWNIHIKNNLNDTLLHKNAELVMTMTASEVGNLYKGYSALVLKLPSQNSDDIGPEFSNAFYIVDYPDGATQNVEIEIPISFKNVNDLSKVTITLDSYTENFKIQLESNKWYVKINSPLDNSILNKNAELVMSITAIESGKTTQGYSVLVLKLPVVNTGLAPIFSEVSYAAEYKISNGQAIVAFTDAIKITNEEDLTKISITVDNYPENFNVTYNRNDNTWVMNVIKQIPDNILLSKTDLVITLTATDATNGLTGQSVVALTLPAFDTETAPKFSKIYYTAKYTITGRLTQVTFDVPLNITNRDNAADITISTDTYDDYFNVIYDSPTNQWKMTAKRRLDQDILNAKVDVAMALLAVDRNTGEIGEAALVLILPIVNNEEAPKFSSIYYSGEYKNDNGASITLDNAIEITNKNNFNNIMINVDDSYTNNFEISYDDDNLRWVIHIISPLTVKDKSEIILTLTATETNNLYIGQSALILRLSSGPEGNKLAPKFSLAHYSAKYIVNDNQASISIDGSITIDNKVDLNNIIVTLDSYNTNFKMNFDSSKKEWTITVAEFLPDTILKARSELVLTLIATEKDNENTGDSTLILTLPSSDNNPNEDYVIFSQIHYSGDYITEGKNGAVKMNEKITVLQSKLDGSNLDVSFQNDKYAEYFTINKESDSYIVSTSQPLPPTVLETEVSVVLTIVAAVGDIKGYATLVINLPRAARDRTIEFSSPLYDGVYKTVDGKGNFQVTGTIQVETAETVDSNIEHEFTSSTGFEEYFKISYANKILTVDLDRDIPESVLRTQSFIPLLLTVGIVGTTDKSTAVLNVDIENNGEIVTPIVFSNILYHGRYEVYDGIGGLKIDDVITVDTDEADSNVEVTISPEYETYFLPSYSGKVIRVSLDKQLPTEILSSNTFIPLTLQVRIKGTSNQASAVLNIEIKYDSDIDTGSIEFATILYGGEYSVNSGTGKLSLNQPIEVITDQHDYDITPDISNDLGYQKYFRATYVGHTFLVTLLEPLPQDVLENSFIALTLTVSIKETTHTSSAVLNININKNQEDTSIDFSKVLYNGRYKVTNGIGAFTITDQIIVQTTVTDDNKVLVSISNEFASYFSISYSDKIITIDLDKQLSTEILRSNSFIPLTLKVEVTGTSNQASAVLNIEIEYDRETDTGSIEFVTVLYGGEYSINNGIPSLSLNEPIEVITDRNDDEITTNISNDLGYEKYFIVSYASHTVSVILSGDLPEEVLEHSFIAFTLTVGIKETTHISSAVLNIDINKNEEDTSIVFPKILFNGRYEITDGIGVLTITDRITVETSVADNHIIISISNEYSSYFSISYSNKVITINLEEQLPTDIVKTNSFISLTLKVQVEGTTSQATAVLNIKIQNNDDENTKGKLCATTTGYLVSIVLLSILVIALIAAAVAFYYFRIRNRSYANLDEERDTRGRFDKNITPRPDAKHNPLEERRPTGFIFKPLSEDMLDGPSDSDKTRRKSVAFDDNVEKMQIESPADEDNVSYDNAYDKSEVTHV